MNKHLPARIAGNLFWMQRYRERADNVCRTARAIICAPSKSEDEHPREWGRYLSAAGGGISEDASGNPTMQMSLDLMLWSRNNPASVAESASRAKFNAQEASDLLPPEAFDHLLRWESKVESAAEAPPDVSSLEAALASALASSAAIEGAIQTQMRRDAAYRFTRLGSLIERADNSARLLLECLELGLPAAESGLSPTHRLKLRAIAESFGLTTPGSTFEERRDPVGFVFGALAFDAARPRSLAHCCASVSEELKCLSSDCGRAAALLKEATKISECVSDFADGRRKGERGESGFLNQFIADNMKLSRAIEVEFGLSK